MIVSIEPIDNRTVESLKSDSIDIIVVERNNQTLSTLKSVSPEVLICRDRDDIAGIVECCHRLRFIFVVEVGVEELPFDLLLEKGIRVANTGGISTDIMSNFVLGCILCHSTRLKENIINQHNSFWKKYQCTESLCDKVLLIVGAGRTGQAVAEKAKVFGMSIYGVQNTPRPTPFFDKTITLKEMGSYLRMSDYIVCTLPQTPATVGLFDYQIFGEMKSSSVFINISRGSLVDEKGLISALDDHLFSAAYLDVFECEPLSSESPLWQHPKIMITPHQSGRLVGYMDQAMKLFRANYLAYRNGEVMPNEIDLKKGY